MAWLKRNQQQMNSFFGSDEENECVNTLVAILHDGLVKQRLLARRPNFTKWKRDFQKALDQGLVFETEIEATLVWYMNNLHGTFMPQAYSPSGFLEKYPAIRKRFLEAAVQNVAPAAQTRMREETNSVGLVPPPEGADDLVSWYDVLVEEGETTPGEIARYAAACRSRSSISR